MDEDIARCTGLWLAEGDTKTDWEVTFTNNCFELVEFFAMTIQTLNVNSNISLQVYKPEKNSNIETLESANILEYVDERASKPYYIVKIQGSELCNRWNSIVSQAKEIQNLYQYILQGFYAGEGYAYESTNASRKVRISQGERYGFLERVLDYFGVSYIFEGDQRLYTITGKRNWDRLAEIEVAKLHPRKRKRFLDVYQNFQIHQYRKGELHSLLLKELEKEERRAVKLGEIFDRSPSRIYTVLSELREEGAISRRREGNHVYWKKV